MNLKNLKNIGTGPGRFVTVNDPMDPESNYYFPARNRRIVKRARKMGIKEPGTIRWLHDTLRPDDNVLDIGANVGIYTLFAARRLQGGRVYAIEPHAGNFAILLESIQVNACGGRVVPLNVALDTAPGWIDFSYRDLLAGSSGSQLDSSPMAGSTQSVVTEKKLAASVDDLVAGGVLPPPDVVKIDVDGNELNILGGMRELLATHRPRSIQVEIDEALEGDILDFMHSCGYPLCHKHFSARGMRLMENGEDPFPYNAVFEIASAEQ